MALQKASCFSNHVYTYIYIEYDFPKEIAMAVDNGLSTLQVKIGLQAIFGSFMEILQCPLDLCGIRHTEAEDMI